MPLHVVPKGNKMSDKRHLEFRLSYTLGEIALMESLNATQQKLFVLLKLLFTHVVGVKFPEVITSYVLKNVVFWMPEMSPTFHFKNELLLERYRESLQFIVNCVTNGKLPNYFIPERNMLIGRLDEETKPVLLQFLSNILSDGPKIVYSIPPLKSALLVSHQDVIVCAAVRLLLSEGEKHHAEDRELETQCKWPGMFSSCAKMLPDYINPTMSSVS